jgi:hypothetical protein
MVPTAMTSRGRHIGFQDGHQGALLSGTRPEMNQYPKKYLCAKFGAFIPICTIFPLAAGLVGGHL